jgi:sulfide dehydrogenase cytochrome subunit
MYRKNHLLLALTVVLVSTSLPASADKVTRGAMLANSCAACHGTDGKSPGSIPAIYGKPADYLSKALMDFRDGKRPSTVMGRHAKGYSNEEIQLIAEFFSK